MCVVIVQGCEGFQVDVCGVCAGDGSSCELFSGTLFLSVLSVGYHKILDIPSGAQRIKIQETQKTRNYLGNGTESLRALVFNLLKAHYHGTFLKQGAI